MGCVLFVVTNSSRLRFHRSTYTNYLLFELGVYEPEPQLKM